MPRAGVCLRPLVLVGTDLHVRSVSLGDDSLCEGGGVGEEGGVAVAGGCELHAGSLVGWIGLGGEGDGGGSGEADGGGVAEDVAAGVGVVGAAMEVAHGGAREQEKVVLG